MDKVRVTEEGVERKSAFDILEEYVNKAQIIDQNKQAVLSEVLTSIMEPKVIELSSIMNGLFNAPEVDDDFEFDIELEGDEQLEARGELEFAEDLEAFTELDSSSVKEIEVLASEVLERSEDLIQSLVDDEGISLEDEVDMAFDHLLSETAKEKEEESVDFDELDISSFISAKISEATPDIPDTEISRSEQNLKEEEAELSAALDQAFAKLNLNNENEDIADDLDLDLDFLKSTLDNDDSSTEL
jgi:hypothetical protein